MFGLMYDGANGITNGPDDAGDDVSEHPPELAALVLALEVKGLLFTLQYLFSQLDGPLQIVKDDKFADFFVVFTLMTTSSLDNGSQSMQMISTQVPTPPVNTKELSSLKTGLREPLMVGVFLVGLPTTRILR